MNTNRHSHSGPSAQFVDRQCNAMLRVVLGNAAPTSAHACDVLLPLCCGYCLDAPETIPTGGMIGKELMGRSIPTDGLSQREVA